MGTRISFISPYAIQSVFSAFAAFAPTLISSLRFALGEVEKQRREAELLLERIAETKSVIASLLGADA